MRTLLAFGLSWASQRRGDRSAIRQLHEVGLTIVEAGARVPLPDMRHTAASLLLAGIPNKVVMQRMGWLTPGMVERYQHLLPQMGDEAAAKLDSLLQ